jgi:hypothetical protein
MERLLVFSGGKFAPADLAIAPTNASKGTVLEGKDYSLKSSIGSRYVNENKIMATGFWHPPWQSL